MRSDKNSTLTHNNTNRKSVWEQYDNQTTKTIVHDMVLSALEYHKFDIHTYTLMGAQSISNSSNTGGGNSSPITLSWQISIAQWAWHLIQTIFCMGRKLRHDCGHPISTHGILFTIFLLLLVRWPLASLFNASQMCLQIQCK